MPLGPTAESLMNDLTKRIDETRGNEEVMLERVVEINTELSRSSESIASNRSRIQDLEWDSEHYNNSQDQTEEGDRQQQLNEQTRDELTAKNEELSNTIKDLIDEKVQHQKDIADLNEQREELVNERETIEEKLPLKERVKQIY